MDQLQVQVLNSDCTEGPFTDTQKTIYLPIGTVEFCWYKYNCAKSSAEKF